jgi:uncharacterized protein (DUF486 family)
MYKYTKEIIRENIVLFIGILLIASSIIFIIASSYREYVNISKSIDIDLSKELLATTSDLLNERYVAETVNGSMLIINPCNNTLHVSVYMGRNYTEYIIDPGSRQLLNNIHLETLIKIDQAPKCVIIIELNITYLRYPLAYLSFIAFILVASGSIMIFRYMLVKAREITKARDT